MWLVFATISIFFLSLVFYIDEYLMRNNKVPEAASIHSTIGAQLLISMLANVIGVAALFLYLGDISLPTTPLLLSIGSAIPMVTFFAIYFYSLARYPVHQVVPVFLLTTLWLLIIELIFGASINLFGLLGILALTAGAYLLDAGTFKIQIPTKLLLLSIPGSISWAIGLYIVRIASEDHSALIVTFWQFVGTAVLGILAFLLIKQYREGFLFRIKHQGKVFLGFSFANETFSQVSYMFSFLAVAIAPVASYVTAVGGAQGVFVMLLFLLFPMQEEDRKISWFQIFATILVALGVFLIEGFK